jgi:iron(III) transport system substrate-binding protein
MHLSRFLPLVITFVIALACGGCSGEGREVVVYTALDREFSEPILADFEKATGIKVQPKYDIESTKTVGLTSAILAEAARPRCDVFWNNEILNTIRLQKAGLLENYKSSAGEPYSAMFRDPAGAWHGFAGRARVLIVNKDLVPEAERRTR